ncbi:MAG: hypothetical protein SPJ34_06005 [Candidatus Ornithospirochaeta sp.]|nr:hypothetical protein [Candidatus Ornithospirochaeta sp.]
MKLIGFETVSRYNVRNCPVTAALPFSKGELMPECILNHAISDGSLEYPFQSIVSSTYSDGSVRFLTLRFLARFEANLPGKYFFVPKEECRAAEAVDISPVAIDADPSGSVAISNSRIKAVLGKPGDRILKAFISSGKVLAEAEGPVINDGNRSYAAFVGKDGWKIEEQGDIHLSLSTRGRHVSEDGATWFDYVIRISMWAECSNLEFEYQIINTEKARTSSQKVMEIDNQQAGLKYDDEYPREILHGLEFRIRPAKSPQTRKGIYTSSFNFHATECSADESIDAVVDADTIMNTANEMFPEVMFSTFGCTWRDSSMLFGAEIFQAYQNFPKALHINKDDIVLSLYPEECEPIEFPQGVQKTSKFYLFAMDPETEERMVVDNLLMLEMPPQPFAEPAEYIKAGIFGKEVSPYFDPPTERFLYRFIDSRAKGLGFLNFGDCPEWEYSKQGRSKGRDIWINNEYDMVHNFVILFARSGDRRYFDYAKAAMRHWIDVDFCHFSERPYHEGLLYTHSVNHVSGQMVPSHQWVQGFFDYYHLTGSREAYDTAMTIGNKLEEMVRLPIYNVPGMVEPREIGWALRNFIDLYIETHDEKWLDDCEPIVDTYIRWADLMGTWTSPYPDNYMDRVPFMMQVGIGGLYEYYRIRGGEKIKSTLLTVIDDIIENCYIPRLDMFLCKMHPSIRFQNLNGMVLETLEIGYRLTGDIKYLEKGLGMFDWITKENAPPIYDFSKVKRDEHTVIYNCPVGPKRFSQTIIPLLRYYTAAMENNLI